MSRELEITQQYVSLILKGHKDPIPAWLRAGLDRVGYEIQFVPKQEEDPVKRRTVLGGMIAAPFVPSPRLGPYDDPDFLRDAAVSLVRKWWENGGLETLATASRHYENIQSILEKADRGLQAAASHLARQIAFVYHDSERFEAAEQAGRFAANLAYRATDMEAQALALSFLSRNAYAQGRGTQAIRYAKSGLAAHDVGHLTHAWLNLRLGCSLALVKGQEHAARKSLDKALDFDALPSNYDPGDMIGHAGYGMYKLGRHKDAYAHLSQAVELTGEWPSLQANFLGWQIRTALSASDPLRAADRLYTFARVAPLVSSARVEQHVSNVYIASRPYEKIPAMRDARDQLYDVMPKHVRRSLPVA